MLGRMARDSKNRPSARWFTEACSLLPNNDIWFLSGAFSFTVTGAEAKINTFLFFCSSPCSLQSPPSPSASSSSRSFSLYFSAAYFCEKLMIMNFALHCGNSTISCSTWHKAQMALIFSDLNAPQEHWQQRNVANRRKREMFFVVLLHLVEVLFWGFFCGLIL